MTIEDDVQQFVIAVRVLSRRFDDYVWQGSSDLSRTCLLLMVEGMLKNKALRVHVLSAITGLPLTSQNQLMQVSTSTLIGQFKKEGEEKNNERIIKYIEETIRKGFAQDPLGFKPQLLYPWER